MDPVAPVHLLEWRGDHVQDADGRSPLDQRRDIFLLALVLYAARHPAGKQGIDPEGHINSLLNQALDSLAPCGDWRGTGFKHLGLGVAPERDADLHLHACAFQACDILGIVEQHAWALGKNADRTEQVAAISEALKHEQGMAVFAFQLSLQDVGRVIQCLLCELGRLGQNSLIVDYTDGFFDSQLAAPTKASLSPVQHYIRQAPLPINPFKKQTSFEEGMAFPDTPAIIAKRVASIFKSVYELGDQQFSLLIDAITQGVEQEGEAFTLGGLTDVLESFLDDENHSKPRVRDTLSKLKPFIQQTPFAGDDNMGWAQLLADTTKRCNIFQFFKVDRHTARALIEFVLWDLYAFARSVGTESTPRVVVLDEVQNLDLGLEAPVGKYLTEGRKFGLSLILATQTLNNLKGDRLSRLFQAAHKLFFRPSDNELGDHAKLLQNSAPGSGTAQDWIAKLSGLQKGECWSLGPALNDKTGKLETRPRCRLGSRRLGRASWPNAGSATTVTGWCGRIQRRMIRALRLRVPLWCPCDTGPPSGVLGCRGPYN